MRKVVKFGRKNEVVGFFKWKMEMLVNLQQLRCRKKIDEIAKSEKNKRSTIKKETLMNTSEIN